MNKRGHGAKNFSVYKEIGFLNHTSAKVAKSLNKSHKKEGILQEIDNHGGGGQNLTKNIRESSQITFAFFGI